MADSVERALAGNPRALGRLASRVESGGLASDALIETIYSQTGNAHVIGITGPPGAGKSTLVNRLIADYRGRSHRVAVIAVDPSSPYSGGAALGDRIRMLDYHNDPHVFIRSMASRGRYGGLAATTAGMIHLFDAAGFDPILVETVGVGQGEAEIAQLAHTTVVVQSPGAGDDIQALKAGILEIASILVVNKADAPGATTLQRVLRTMLAEGQEAGASDCDWNVPVVLTTATEHHGADVLVAGLDQHLNFLHGGSKWDAANEQRAVSEISSRVMNVLQTNVGLLLLSSATTVANQVACRELSPVAAAARLFDELKPHVGEHELERMS